MERQKDLWLDCERHYLHSIMHGCRELRHYLLPLYDSCNTEEFFWSIETILSACFKAEGLPKPDKPIDEAPEEKSQANDEGSSDDRGNKEGDRVDLELMKMPLMKLLKMELEALFKLTRKRKKLLQYFSSSVPEIDPRVLVERKVWKMATRILEKTERKLPKYQTLLEYQVVLGCCITEQTETEIPPFPYFKYFTRAYGSGFIDSRKYWSEVMSLMLSTIKKKTRPRETRSKDEVAAAKKEFMKCKPIRQPEASPPGAKASRIPENGRNPEADYERNIFKNVRGYVPHEKLLKKAQLFKQPMDDNEDGAAFGSKKSEICYSSTCVPPQKSNSL